MRNRIRNYLIKHLFTERERKLIFTTLRGFYRNQPVKASTREAARQWDIAKEEAERIMEKVNF